MDRIRLFLKRLKRFFSFLFIGIVKSLARQQFQIIVESASIITTFAAVAGLLGLIILVATILTHSWINFSDDFTWNNFIGSAMVTSMVTSIGGLVALLCWMTGERIVYLVKHAWSDSSNRALATRLWE